MTSVDEIGYFRVTDREFDRALDASGLDQDDLLNLPTNAVIAEIGSGLNQNFANEIKNVRQDVKVVSLDPTYNLPNSKFFTTHERGRNGKLEQVSYTYFGENSFYKGEIPEYADPSEITEVINEERASQAKKTENVVSGLAPEIPFASESLDMLIDLWGPGLYLKRYSEGSQLEEYLQNIVRVLKKGGQARIYPIDYYNEAMEENDTRNANAIKEYQNILQKISNIKIEFYEQDDPALKNRKTQTRVGIKIGKFLIS